MSDWATTPLILNLASITYLVVKSAVLDVIFITPFFYLIFDFILSKNQN
jgi:hypothetical protein